MKTILYYPIVALLLVLVFDATMFHFLPDDYASQFPDYRRDPPPSIGGYDRYPNGYFVKHAARGFDIGRNREGAHWVDGVAYPIWSNSLGCFDDEPPKAGDYIYFAGDSQTWGYTPFEQKFGTIVEQRSGKSVVKCGVTHTGQLHQFDKFLGVVEEIGYPPRAVLVFYDSNDPANDYAYPHATVIDGWLVNSASLDEENEIVRHADEELREKLKLRLKEIEEKSASWRWRFNRSAKPYSLSLNVAVSLKNRLAKAVQGQTGQDSGGRTRKQIYSLPKEKGRKFWYEDNPNTRRNKGAILQFKKWAINNGVDLIVALIPPKTRALNASWYEELRGFLTTNEISHVDLAPEFKRRGLASQDLYWNHDAHFNPRGNEAVAEILIDELQHLFQKRRASPSDPDPNSNE